MEKITPHDPTTGRGRPPYPPESMPSVHCLQLFYSLNDPAMEDMLYEVESVRRFCGIRLEKVPDEPTILNFRHLLECHEMSKNLFETIKEHPAGDGLLFKKGTILDASIMEARSSTKNRSGERDPEMKQSRKANQRHFGMKLPIGVDDQSGLVHGMETNLSERA